MGVEVLSLNSWAKLCQYDTFKDLLCSGLTFHLKQNEVLRDVLQMGPVQAHSIESKAVRLEKVSDGCAQRGGEGVGWRRLVMAALRGEGRG